MSYSRFGDGEWYTYWNCTDAGPNPIDDSVLCINCSHCISGNGFVGFAVTSEDIRKNIDACLALARSKAPKASDEDLSELKEYMLRFLNDVDHEFNTDNEGVATQIKNR